VICELWIFLQDLGQISSGYGSQFLIFVNIFGDGSVRTHGSYQKAVGRNGHREIKTVSVMK